MKKLLVLLVAAACIVVVLTGVASAQTTTAAPPLADTHIRQNAPTTNYGALSTVNVDGDDPGGSGKDTHGLIKFDLSGIPQGNTVSAVNLQFSVTNSSLHSYNLYALKKDWSESGATWNAAKTGTSWSAPGAAGTADRDSTSLGTLAPTASGAYSLTLNSTGVQAVQDMVKGTRPNHGFVLASSSSTDGFDFHSRTGTTRPVLAVTHSAPAASNPPETTLSSWIDHDSSTPIDEDGSGSETTRLTYSVSNATGAQYSLDGGAWTVAGASPALFSVLADGKEHTLSVRATRSSDGAVDSTPATAKMTMCPRAGCSTVPVTPPSAGFEYGLRMGHTWWLSDAQLNADLDRAKNAGATTVQIVTSWRKLAPTTHRQYDWSYLDKVVSAAESRGIKAHLQLEKSPAWMEGSCSSCSSFTPPRTSTALQQFREFAQDVAARYGTRAHRIEVWNEPNLTGFWETPEGPNPVEFAALQRAGYLGVKAGNPNVRVTSGSISNADQGFLNKFYDAVGAYSDAAQNNKFFDELGLHPYSSCGYPNATALAPDQPNSCALWTGKWGPVDNNFGGYKKMRTIMEQRGDSHKKMYFGEMGYQATYNDPHWMNRIEDSTRADWLKKAYSLAGSEGYVSGISWYSYVEDPRWNIVKADGWESLTFRAFRDVTP